MKNKIYFAGKIGFNDWRHDIVGMGLRNAGQWNRDVWQSDGPDYINLDNGDIYCGPFFVSDDHGCGHGPNSHGTGNENTNCFTPPSRKEVFNRCIKQISESDYVFCWLSSKEAYGTLFELGVAFEKKKKIFLAIDESLRKTDDKSLKEANDFWFSRIGCWYTEYYNNHYEAWNKFLELTNPNFESEKKDFDKLMSTLKEYEKDDYIELAKRQPMSKVITYFKRNKDHVNYLKEMYDGKCQVKNCGYTFKKSNGDNYCETHHLLELFKYRIDDPKVMVCVCPNHHKLLHFGTDEEKSKLEFEYKDEHLKLLEVYK
jgi:nucleoside 2-deoxyribosyltransferase